MTDSTNVLIFSSSSKYQKKGQGGGAETSLRLIAEKLVEKGINVTYFTNGISRIPGIRKKIINGVEVYYFTPWRWPFLKNKRLFSFASKFITRQKQKALAKLIKDKNIRIVHTYVPFPDTFNIIKIRKEYNLEFSIVMRVAGLHWINQLNSKLIKPSTIEFVFNNVDVMNYLDIGLKKLSDEKCKEFGINVAGPKSFIHDIGVDLNYYQERKIQPKNDHFTMICTARFSQTQKRHDILIEVIKKLKDQNIYVEFAGNGPLLKKYKKQVENASLQHLVKFHGFLKKEELRDIMKTADLAILSTDYEGVSKAVVEAMSMKIPVLVSDVSALNRFLTNNETGFLVENTVEKWAESILMLTKDRNSLSKVAAAGCRYARDHYDADININQYIKIFQSLYHSH